MTREVAEKIIRGITDKIECNTADMDDWAEFWGFTREDYEEFLDLAIKALEQEPKTGHWVSGHKETGALGITYTGKICSSCGWNHSLVIPKNYCPNCGAKMV